MNDTNEENVKSQEPAESGSSVAICLPQCPYVFKIGDYVFATRWGDADWNDPWGVGFVAELGKNYVSLSNENGSLIAGVGRKGFKHAMKIDPQQGLRIVEEYSPLEGTGFDTDAAFKIIFGR